MLTSSLDQLFKVNPMVVILCSITVLLLIAFLAGSIYLIAKKDQLDQ